MLQPLHACIAVLSEQSEHGPMRTTGLTNHENCFQENANPATKSRNRCERLPVDALSTAASQSTPPPRTKDIRDRGYVNGDVAI